MSSMPSNRARDGSSRLVLLRLTRSEDYTMLSWFQRKPSPEPAKPEINPANPGVGVKASVAFAQALRQYASTWLQAGYEFRKQYVVIHDLPAPERDVDYTPSGRFLH